MNSFELAGQAMLESHKGSAMIANYLWGKLVKAISSYMQTSRAVHNVAPQILP